MVDKKKTPQSGEPQANEEPDGPVNENENQSQVLRLGAGPLQGMWHEEEEEKRSFFGERAEGAGAKAEL
ncbi:hypothetical protein MMC29_002719, partial [Sticta canariensis]|nr:hypothetical protein [Sticta canariensis]